MRRLLPTSLSILSFSLEALFLLSCVHPEETKLATPKAIFIVLDGISADVIEDIDPPVLADIAKTGGYTRAYVGGGAGTYSETPTISAVGYNSLLTGTWANKHNVWDNDIEDPNYNYQTIFRVAEEFNPKLHTAIFSTWTDNRTKLIGEGLAETGNMKLDYSFDGLEFDTIIYPHDDQSDYIHKIDEAVANEAARYVAEKGPDLSWVYLQYTDDMGHRHGDSEKFYDAIRLADAQVGRIWNAIKARERNFDEHWLIVITTDHGRDSTTGKHHGGQSPRERLTWIYTNADSLNERFNQMPAVVDIMPSIANHMGIRIPAALKQEIDGVPFIGPVDFSNLNAETKDRKIALRWKHLSTAHDAKAEVLVATANHYKQGGKDSYSKVGEVHIADESFSFDAPANANFLKVLVKGPHHSMNVWVNE